MCGLLGYTSLSSSISSDSFSHILSSLNHRGPDSSGIISIRNGHLGHTRLSIQDLSDKAGQPFISACNRYFLVYNGEIYNCDELRSKLAPFKPMFRTSSDTEVLMYLLVYFGSGAVEFIRGMFSFVFFDSHTNDFILCRDHLGIKPLFYFYDGNTLAFSSEINPLLELLLKLGLNYSISSESLRNYLYAGYVPSPSTFYDSVSSLSPGALLSVNLDNSHYHQSQWFSLSSSKIQNSFPQSITALSNTLCSVVGDHLVGDVEPAVLLSGGIDSSLLAYYAVQNGIKPSCFTINYVNDPNSSELPYAKYVAAKLGLELHVVDIDFTDSSITQVLDSVLDSTSLPFANSTLYVQKMVCNHIHSLGYKYALSGDGADELFCGYPRYKAVYLNSLIPNWLLPVARTLSSLISTVPETPHFNHFVRRSNLFLKSISSASDINEASLSYFLQDKAGEAFCSSSFLRAKSRRGVNSILDSISCDYSFFLPFNLMYSADLASSAFSVELRVPFLDRRLLQYVNPSSDINLFQTKARLKYIASSIFGRNFAYRSKRGFNPPLWSILRYSQSEVKDLLFSSRELALFFGESYLQSLFSDHFSSRSDYSKQLWSLLSLARFFRLHPEYSLPLL